jgi:hypothetical protein
LALAERGGKVRSYHVNDFRYNARVALGVHDDERAARAWKGVKGKRLTYRTTRGAKPEA